MSAPGAGYRALRVCVVLAAALASAPGRAGADPLGPVAATNLTPFTAILGAPSLRSARLPGPGRQQWFVDAALASHSAIGLRGGEFAYLDGETLRVAVEYRRQLTAGWQVAIIAPWIHHRRGFLDSLIDDWHALTGLSNGQRDVQRRDRIGFEYAGERAAYELRQPAKGLGDLRIEAVNALPPWRGMTLAWRGSLELPTGAASRLTGNEGLDVAVDLLLRRAGSWRGRPLAWHAQLGVLLPGAGDVLPALRRRVVPVAGIGAVWAWRPSLQPFFQAAIMTAPWHSGLAELGETGVELTAGARLGGGWHLAFSEDLRIDRSPDFVARLGWRSGNADRVSPRQR